MSSLFSPRWWFCAFVGAGFVDLRAAEASELSRAEAELAKKFAGVTQWQGIYEVSVIGAATISRANGYHLESRYEAKGHGTFTLDRATEDGEEPAAGFFTWTGKGQARGGGAGTFSEWGQRGIGEEWSQEFSGTVGQERIEFSLGLRKKSAQLHAGVQRGEPVMRRTGQMVSAQGSGNKVSPIDTTFPAPIDVWFLGTSEADAARRWQVVSDGPGVLAFTYEGPAAGRSQKFQVSGAGVIQRSKVILFPVYEDLEVEVTIADYAKWRPRGSIADPKKPGNTLVARATLKSKSGTAKAFPPIKEFRFELMDTSREPGVCLNWPLEAKDEDYDLRLATASTGGELSDRDQKLAINTPPTNSEGRPYAEATVESFDFGARAELRVVCELEDGSEIIGLMKDEGGEQDLVRLPKMSGPDWIAESWRREKDVMKLAAGADAEKVDGQKDDGDGYTLYEEYRGWAVNGQHVEGDPKRKDFFVLNLIEGDGRGGIALFAQVSKLRVHSRLRDGREISQEKRLMNGNHRDAPHRVAQHGVVLSHEGMGAGGYNVGIEGVDKTKAGRPRTVKWVYVETHHPNGAFAAKNSAEYNLSERDAALAYDRAVAHELLHSVGVDHHGEQVWSFVRCNFQGASAALNPTRRARYTSGFSLVTFQIQAAEDWRGDRGDTITLLWEDTRRDVVEDAIAAYEAALAKHRADDARSESYARENAAEAARMATLGVSRDAAFWSGYNADIRAAREHHRGIRVGAVGGTDCGNDRCIMKYYFANAYRIAGRENAYYLIRPGSGANRAGRDLCTSPAGTGTNAQSHQPQSRFGDAHEGRGNCFGDICPNDAIPPRSVKLK